MKASLQHPAFLLLLAMVPAWIAFVLWSERRRREEVKIGFHPTLADRILSAVSPVRRIVKTAWGALAIACFVVALAGPRWGEEPALAPTDLSDSALVLDVSLSMSAMERGDSRLDLAKAAIHRGLKSGAFRRACLVTFAGNADLLSPATADRDLLWLFIDALGPESAPRPGTRVGEALALARNHLGPAEDRRVFLVTDGEDFDEATEKEAARLAAEGVHLMILCVGSSDGSVVERKMGEPLRTNGIPVLSRARPEAMARLAEIGGGRMFRLGNGIDETEAFWRSAPRKSGSAATRNAGGGEDRSAWFLLIGALAALLEAFQGDRRRRRGAKP